MIELPEKLKEKVEKISKERGLNEEEKQKLLEKAKEVYLNSLYEPGEAIGPVAAQSISEPATQMTMRSYTLASLVGSITKVVQGLPRLIEIFDLRRTFDKSMTIYLKEKYNNKTSAERIANEIRERKIKDIVKGYSIDLVQQQIEREFDHLDDAKKFKEILSKYGETIRREKAVTIKVKKSSIIDLQTLKKLKDKILESKVGGISGIKRVVVTTIGNDWVIQTTGSNLKDVLKLEFIDPSRTTTDDIHQIYDVLGIEAARNAILREAKATLDEQGLYVDVRHIMLVADMMTKDGAPKPIGRYGIAGEKPSVLARANFEETKKHLRDAAVYGEVDELRGAIENIMIGQLAPIGTGMVKLIVDLEKFKKKKK
ncbi:MAG: DNA-directed RNA polymerase subunit A'' [Candidatus Aenigmarchaeota archaeon]|nr:DNA-directed RNA polymerase subunit A'' [Candidatus Aenigmarchaeota archaeon]